MSRPDITTRYSTAKLDHPDEILAMRFGDFYEVLFADAKLVADVLDITLTTRKDAPMCGFPVHSASRYVEILEAAGHRVVLA